MKIKSTTDSRGTTPQLAIRVAIPLLGFAGMVISGYLTYIHYQNIAAICLFNAKCDVVLASSYSQMWGIPLSLLGLVMYIVITALGLGMLLIKGQRQVWAAMLTYVVALSGVIFTGYLYFLEIFVIKAFCSLCIASSIVLVTICVLSVVNLSLTVLMIKGINTGVSSSQITFAGK